MFQMNGKSKMDMLRHLRREELFRRKGKSLFIDPAEMKDPPEELPIDISKPLCKLSDELKEKAARLFPLVQVCSGGEYACCQDWLDEFTHYIVPEEPLFLMQTMMLACIDAFIVLDVVGESVLTMSVEELARNSYKIPVPTEEALGMDWALESLRRRPKPVLEELHRVLFGLMAIGADESVKRSKYLRLALLSTMRMKYLRADLAREVIRATEVKYGKVLGARCAGCRKVGKGFKMCSGCAAAFYCTKECQRKHWPNHKKECKRTKEGINKAAPRTSTG